VTETGAAYACCVPGAFAPALELGRVPELSLQDLRDRSLLGGVQQILRTEGPIALARAAQAAGLGSRLRGGYQGVCDLCTHLATDPVLSRVVSEAGNALEASQAEALLQRVASAARDTPASSSTVPQGAQQWR
jgi:hypothetical protein